MDFKSVFGCLLETFPQVDSRILKAVAIEHSRDVDAAVEFILCEVLPSISVPSEASYIVHDTQEREHLSAEVWLREQVVMLGNQGIQEVHASHVSNPKSIACGTAPSDDSARVASPCTGEVVEGSHTRCVGGSEEQCLLIPHHEVIEEWNASPPAEQKLVEREVSDCSSDSFHIMSRYLDEMVAGVSLSNIHGGNNHDQLLSHAEPEEVSLVEHMVKSCLGLADDGNGALHANAQELYGIKARETISIVQTNAYNFSSSILEKYPDLVEYGAVGEKDVNRSSVSDCEEQLSSCSVEPTDTVSAASTSDHYISSSVPERSMDYIECGAEVPKDVNSAVGEYEECHSSCLAQNSSELLAYGTEMVSVDDIDLPTTLATRSGHVVNIDLVEEFVTDAKSNKKSLVFAVESVINMMKEVELLEESAKQAKEEAFSVGQDILIKVEELKQILKHAKQANDMHAGEVYGEKAILSTEARELQFRLLNLSDERSKSLSIIEEIRQTLKARLAAAENDMAAAKQEKLEKEELARKALKEQELIMDAIVEESKKLQQEAAENSKLRDFLIDRGCIVDTLQGELAVICEDVMLLKERVDGRVPLNRSLRLTTCSLASSSSSSSDKSIPSSDKILPPVELNESPRVISEDSSERQQQESIITNSGEEINAGDNHKVSSDDDWEFFYDDACPF